MPTVKFGDERRAEQRLDAIEGAREGEQSKRSDAVAKRRPRAIDELLREDDACDGDRQQQSGQHLEAELECAGETEPRTRSLRPREPGKHRGAGGPGDELRSFDEPIAAA